MLAIVDTISGIDALAGTIKVETFFNVEGVLSVPLQKFLLLLIQNSQKFSGGFKLDLFLSTQKVALIKCLMRQ